MTGSCDCCGKVAVLHSGYAAGIETYACASCFGHPADEWDDEAAEPVVALGLTIFAGGLLLICGLWITGSERSQAPLPFGCTVAQTAPNGECR